MSKLWGGRFDKKSDSLADEFSFSIDYDYRLAKCDVIVSQAHVDMLAKCGIITKTDAAKLISGLKKIEKEIEEGKFKFNPKEEDIHSDIQSRLKKSIGAPADKLHTARSRNDLIVCDMKMYLLIEIPMIINYLAQLQKAIIGLAEKYSEVIIPAYTHLQAAQVVLFSHHLLAYVEMLERDKWRLLNTVERADVMPLGSCALSGTSLPINRKMVAESLGFDAVTPNSIDSVSDRDFIVETLSSLAIVGMHFSRMAEDMILWATTEFNFVDIDMSLCTGSSIMPHKKNPDMCELIRGESAKLYANLQEILVLLKGLPLTYNRDLQLDKPPLFESLEKVEIMTQLLTKTYATLKVKEDVLENRIQHESFFSVDVMEYLIKKGVSYRDAHDVIGKMVRDCIDKGNKLTDMEIKTWKKFHPKFEEDVKKLLNPKMSVKIKQSFGSTNPSMVKKQIKEWKKILKE